MTRRAEDVAPLIRSLFEPGSPSGLTDAQLLGRFAGGEGEASALAFEALVGRHGPMVLRVCRGVLRDPHDAQDAFQATFLVLVRKAGSIRDRDSVASWLHGVALRVATHARASAARRRRLERERVGRIGPPVNEGAGDDLGARLHEEVARLPGRYRAAVVLCYLEGHTCEDAARILRWPVGTVKSRLSRARERLRGRLTRLGLAPSSALAVAPLAPQLVKATARAAGRFGARSSAQPPAPGAVALAEGVLKVMTFAKLKLAGFALLAAASSLGIAYAVTPSQAPPGEAAQAVQEPARAPKAEATPKVAQAKEDQEPGPDPIALTIPRDLAVKAGSGTALMYALDAKGDRIPAARGAAKADEDSRKADASRKEALGKAEAAMKAGDPMALQRAFVEAKALIEQASPQNGPWLEGESDLRWVAITGILNNQAIREAQARARKIDLAESYPEYKRIRLQRQIRSPEGEWSSWMDVNETKNYEILDNIPEVSPERMPAELRPPALVDPLPILKKGAWSGVDPEAIPRLPVPAPDGPPDFGKRRFGSPVLAIRCLDFTVEPGKTYRYRARVVVVNPDYVPNPESAPKQIRELLAENPQADREHKEFFSPWSVPTEAVAVP